MARHAGNVLSRTQLSEHVWDMNFEPTSNVVDVYIGYLRNKVDKPFSIPVIKTVRGHGYMLDPAASETHETLQAEASVAAAEAAKVTHSAHTGRHV
ncbi:hypothetical protein E3A20_16250 [Planctomyces bekefii]|uniref:OmpR/PhoB-type domain-containing protein n=1 Tax=Planctomyces bekefii TaxID=1653850 RepID=A0A5C6M3H3_9PLAN|nr:hypothetical protein E3A20_16250 [Planctomyces bekefii]